jgi:hypothetical protein
MDGTQFDNLMRRIEGLQSRRSIVGVVVVGGLAAALRGVPETEAVEGEARAKGCPRAGRCGPGYPNCGAGSQVCVCVKRFSGNNACVNPNTYRCARNADCKNCRRSEVCLVNGCGCPGGGIGCAKPCRNPR